MSCLYLCEEDSWFEELRLMTARPQFCANCRNCPYG